MADLGSRLAENVAGKFYVDRSCIACVSCHSIAPDFFTMKDGNQNSFVHRQPFTPQEEELCREAMRECPVDAIGDDGASTTGEAGAGFGPDPFSAALRRSIERFGDRTFLVDAEKGKGTSYLEFGRSLMAVKGLLASLGVGPGDVVAIESENSSDLAISILGVIDAGAIAMPLNPKLTQAERDKLLAHSGAKAIFAEGCPASCPVPFYPLSGMATASKPEGIPEIPRDGRGGGLLIYTSGTTGLPKGVLLSSRVMEKNIQAAIDAFGLDGTHRKLCLLPLFHTFGFISDLCAMAFCGGVTVIQKTFDLGRISEVGRAIREYRVDSFSAVPLIFDLLLRMEADLGDGTLRYCVSGAAALSERTRIGFERAYGVKIIPAYGLTECTCFCAISPPSRIRPGSVGLAAGVDFAILDEEEKPLRPGCTGEVAVRGPSVMEGGYFRNDLPCFARKMPGYFKTGDLGYLDEDGYLFITGRKKNMVIRGGEKIYLEDVDRCLLEIEGVKDAATVKAGDGEIETVVSFLVAEEGSDLSVPEVRERILALIGPQKCPDRFVFVGNIPRTPTNKVKIRELADFAREFA
jgi:acyl-CoA synthetase (AMP-forming)/AMP-acid ligase II/ferredoxin